MSALYTILLILKSLFPFLREVVFRDKGLRELLLSNKAATGLACCLLVMFLLFYYVKVVAELTHNRNLMLTAEVTALKKEIDDKKLLIDELSVPLKNRPLNTRPTANHTPRDPPPVVTPKPKPKKSSLRDYAMGRLKTID